MRNPLHWFRRPAAPAAPPGAAPRIAGRLRGTFFVRREQISGWIDADTLSPGVTVEFFVRRGPRTLAACPGVWLAEPERFTFKLPIPGGFEPQELLDNLVTVTARTSEGDTGTLTLDGAAQLDLIRRYLGPPADFVLDLDFTKGGNARAHMGAGWSPGEAEYNWTDGAQSVLRLPTPQAAGNYALRITAGGHLRPPDLTRQHTEVLVDGTFIGNVVITAPNPQYTEIRFAGAAFTGDGGESELRFRHLHATRPSSLPASKDDRNLALFFRRLTLARLHEPDRDPGGTTGTEPLPTNG